MSDKAGENQDDKQNTQQENAVQEPAKPMSNFKVGLYKFAFAVLWTGSGPWGFPLMFAIYDKLRADTQLKEDLAKAEKEDALYSPTKDEFLTQNKDGTYSAQKEGRTEGEKELFNEVRKQRAQMQELEKTIANLMKGQNIAPGTFLTPEQIKNKSASLTPEQRKTFDDSEGLFAQRPTQGPADIELMMKNYAESLSQEGGAPNQKSDIESLSQEGGVANKHFTHESLSQEVQAIPMLGNATRDGNIAGTSPSKTHAERLQDQARKNNSTTPTR